MAVSNDQCTGAESISFDETVQGSTIDSVELVFDNCGSAQGGTNNSAPGRWYIVEGTGDEMMAFVNATYDVQLIVYQGVDCASLACVGGTEGLAPDFARGYVTFDSMAGESYTILVSGFSSAVGLFDLIVSVPQVAANDQCSNAIELTMDEPIAASTVFATNDTDSVDDYCTLFETDSPGIWFTVQGSGSRLQATISENNFAAQLSVYSGSCTNLTCVGGEVANLDYLIPPLVWDAEDGITYFVLIHSLAKMVGEFVLVVTEATAPENDSCEGAIALSLPTMNLTGTTVGATLDNVTHCGG